MKRFRVLLVVLLLALPCFAQSRSEFFSRGRFAGGRLQVVIELPCPSGYTSLLTTRNLNTDGIKYVLCQAADGTLLINSGGGGGGISCAGAGTQGLVLQSNGAGDCQAESVFAYNPATNTLNVQNIVAPVSPLVLGAESTPDLWRVFENGPFVPNADNANDIGTDAVRVRTGYFRSSVRSPVYDFGAALAFPGCGGDVFLTASTVDFILRYCDGSTGFKLNAIGRPGGVVTKANLTDPVSTYFFKEDFLMAGAVCDPLTTNTRICGEGAWWLTGSGATASMAGPAANELNHPGLRIVRTGATATNNAEFQWTAALGSLAWDNVFDTIWVIKPENSDANTLNRVGLSNDAGTSPPTNGVYLEKLAADTNWFLVCRAAAAQTRTDSGIAHGTGWFTFRVRRLNATDVNFSLCSGEACTLPAETTKTTNCPTGLGEARGTMFINTANAATKGIFFDYQDLLVTGLVR